MDQDSNLPVTKEIKPIEEIKRVTPIDELPTVGAPLPIDDLQMTEPEPEDVMDEVRQMPAFRDYEREHRGDGLTFGDY